MKIKFPKDDAGPAKVTFLVLTCPICLAELSRSRMARPEMAIKRYLSAFFLRFIYYWAFLGQNSYSEGPFLLLIIELFFTPINRQLEKPKTGDLRLACSPIKFNDFLVENLQFEGN